MSSNNNLLIEKLAFYGAYHSEFRNQVVHIIFVPFIIFSAYILLGLVHRSLPFALWVAYSLFFLYLDQSAGIVASSFYFILLIVSDKQVVRKTLKQGAKAVPAMSRKTAFAIGMFFQVLSWVLQVSVGHGMFEGTKPALLDSLVDAFSLAPFFVVYEALWMLFPGFQPELKMSVEQKVIGIHQQWGKI